MAKARGKWDHVVFSMNNSSARSEKGIYCKVVEHDIFFPPSRFEYHQIYYHSTLLTSFWIFFTVQGPPGSQPSPHTQPPPHNPSNPMMGPHGQVRWKHFHSSLSCCVVVPTLTHSFTTHSLTHSLASHNNSVQTAHRSLVVLTDRTGRIHDGGLDE